VKTMNKLSLIKSINNLSLVKEANKQITEING
jgi:hypothetical protein